VLLGAGALGAAGILAACGEDGGAPPGNGGDGGGESDPTTATTAPGGGTTTGGQQPAPGGIDTAEIPAGSGKIFPNQKIVVTQPAEGEFKAFRAICTHMGCELAMVSGDSINCNCHGSQFSVADGSVKRGPASRALTARTVTVSGDTLTVS
jgi:Rieske Fe-S protein